MKKSHKRLLIFLSILMLILLLNSFISNILTGYKLLLLLAALIVLFKYLFGIEKDRHRYVKDVIFDMVIVILISFILYYISGIFIGFTKSGNYYNFYGFKTFIFPTILLVVLKEYFRFLILTKSENSKLLVVLTTILFVLIDITNYTTRSSFSSPYNTFIYFSLTLLPAVSNNICCTYICTKLGYKPNLVWLLVTNLYYYLLPLVPSTGEYITAIIKLIFPVIILFKIIVFFGKENDDEVERKDSKVNWSFYAVMAILIVVIVYFTSGKFHYQALAIGSGSMYPEISKGDVVIIEKVSDDYKFKKGEIIAYKRNNIVVVHRLVDIVNDKNEYFYYTKGDNNTDADSYIVKRNFIVGVVKNKIPYIGYPTVSLSELAN